MFAKERDRPVADDDGLDFALLEIEDCRRNRLRAVLDRGDVIGMEKHVASAARTGGYDRQAGEKIFARGVHRPLLRRKRQSAPRLHEYPPHLLDAEIASHTRIRTIVA